MEKDTLQHLLSAGMSIEQIAKRFGKHPSTISYWLKKYDLESPYKDRHAAKGPIDRAPLVELIEAGCTIAEIAASIGRSKATVRHWMRAYGLRTRNGRGARSGPARQAARAAGRLTAILNCRVHGETEFILEGRGSHRCKRCRSERVSERRRKIKRILVEEAGGRCLMCGYDRDIGALHFHHTDPREKRFELSRCGVTYSLEAARLEAQKSLLLCGNCHAEVEGDRVEVPLEFRPP